MTVDRPVEERLLKLEIAQRATDARLEEGSRTFEAMRGELKAKAWVRWAQVIGAIGLIAAIAFAAGRYPDRSEFETSVGRVHNRLDTVERDVGSMRVEQVRIRTAAEATQRSVDSLDRKLDRALDERDKGRRR